MKNLTKTALLLLTAWLFISCEPIPKYWTNLYIQIDPENPNELAYTHNVNNGWNYSENCAIYCVNFETWTGANGKEMYRLEYVGEFEFNAAYFTGFNNIRLDAKGQEYEDFNAEMQFLEKSAFGFIATGELKVDESYEISLSRIVYRKL
jgi:hypothetical protein